MARIITIHSFCRGTGRTNLAANLATLMAAEGRRVCVVDTDLTSPSLHILFALKEEETSYLLNDYFENKCRIEQAAYDITSRLEGDIKGRLFFVPSSARISDKSRRLLCAGCDMDMLNEGFQRLGKLLDLDVLILDTQAGINEDTLVLFALTNVLVVIADFSRHDSMSSHGTAVTVDVARRLDMSSRIFLVANKVPPLYEFQEVRAQVERAYECEVVAVLPQSLEMMALGSAGIFVLRYPHHPLTTGLRQILANDTRTSN